jgi:hypothetical protein
MTGVVRKAIAGALMVSMSSIPTQVGAAERSEGDSKDSARRVVRVRGVESGVTTLIRAGEAQSATFKRLLNDIEATDGLVYVERGRCGGGVRSCLYFPESANGPTRVLRIYIDDRKPDRDVIPSIGHELQHALEVLREPAVRSPAEMHLFYHRLARRVGNLFETEAAIAAGNAVRAELKRWELSQ